MIDYIDKFKLQNKVAVILGGAGLIGSEISKVFSYYGAKTIILDANRKKGKEIEKYILKKNFEAKFIYFNFNSEKNFDKEFIKIINLINCPDIFVNCSYPKTKDWYKNSFKNITKKSMDKNILMHLNSYAWFARLIAEKMKKEKIKGSIIQLGSIYGLLGQDLSIYKNTTMNENMTYSIIKGGITNLTKQMASYYGKSGIRINTLCPGGLLGHVQGSSQLQEKSFIKNYSKKVPIGRLGLPTEIAFPALFLASEASSYITGTTLIVDGGWTSI